MRIFISRILIIFVLVTLLTQCNNELTELKIDSSKEKELLQLRQQLMNEILIMGKDEAFREFVLSECLKQEHGDYNVYLTKIISHFNAKSNTSKFRNSLESIVTNIKALNGGQEPLVFYPKAETIEVEINNNTTKSDKYYLQEPIGVYQEPIGDGIPINPNPSPINPPYSSPGYVVDNGYSLVYYQHITEDYAWENDVWVIGEEENVSPENMIANPEDSYIKRYQGQPERGGIIQVTDLNAIEHWTKGKLEFRMYVFNASGAKIVDRKFGKTKRKNFKDSKWYDFNQFIGNWNTSTFGNWMYENWWEEDGGASASVTISFPPPSGQTGPTVSATIPSRNRDDDLGLATIQFTDAITQVYNISFANIKRKN